MNPDWINNSPDKILTRAGLWPFTAPVGSVLEVGCGISFRSRCIPSHIHVGLDAHWPYLQKVRDELPEAILVNSNAESLSWLFLNKSFSIVALYDILEHLEKPAGQNLLAVAERLARQAVVVASPIGYVPQNIDIWGMGGDRWQTHRSSWSQADLIASGYSTTTEKRIMSDAKRHTSIDVPRECTMVYGIKVMK